MGGDGQLEEEGRERRHPSTLSALVSKGPPTYDVLSGRGGMGPPKADTLEPACKVHILSNEN